MNRTDGLWLFLTIQSLVFFGLVYDLVLWRFEFVTISDFCQRHWWAAALVIGLKCVGTVGLANHFFAKNGEVLK